MSDHEFTIGDRLPGLTQSRGKSAGIEVNYAFKATDTNGDECILIHCNPDSYVVLDNEETLSKIRKINDKPVSWYIMKCGYAAAHIKENDKDTCIYLHQYLLNHKGYGKGKVSVDHINQNKLDNRLVNLRLATQSTQNENRQKVSRHTNAKELPTDISNEKFPKFVVYYKEKVNNTHREYFTVEGHPLQKQKMDGIVNSAIEQLTARRWTTTKSGKIPISDKLHQAKMYVAELNILLEDPTYTIKIPTCQHTKKVELKSEVIPVIIAVPVVIQEASVKHTKKLEYKQWKAQQIFVTFQSGEEEKYKKFCEDNNNLTSINWEEHWNNLKTNIKGKKFEESKVYIDGLIALLRKIRHDTIVKNYNNTRYSPEKEGRQQWPAKIIVKVFTENKIELFKNWLIEQDTFIDEAKWSKLLFSLTNAESEKERIDIAQKYLRNRRTTKWRNK